MKASAIITLFAIALMSCKPSVARDHSHDLPLGDGKIGSAAKSGYVMACQSHFPGGGGAQRSGDWIQDGYWNPSAKPQVEGAIKWPNAKITITREGNERVVRANNLPTHPSGEFPVKPGTRAYEYDRNPNISANRISCCVCLRRP